MRKTRFEGTLVRNLLDKRSWSKRDLPLKENDVRLTLMTMQEAQQQLPRLQNLPLLMAHNPTMQIGRVISAHITPKRELRAILELDDEETLACHGIREKILHALSLSHCVGENMPYEVSLCKTPRRKGCMIDFELNPRNEPIINSKHSAIQHDSQLNTFFSRSTGSDTILQTNQLLGNMSSASETNTKAPAVAPAHASAPQSTGHPANEPKDDANMDISSQNTAAGAKALEQDAKQKETSQKENANADASEMTPNQILAELLSNENMPEVYRDSVMSLAKDRLMKDKQLQESQKELENQQKKIKQMEQEAERLRKSHQTDRDWMKSFMSTVMKNQDLNVSQSDLDASIEQGHLDPPIVRQLVQCMGQKLKDQQLVIPMNRQQQDDLAHLKELRDRNSYKFANQPIARPAAAVKKNLKRECPSFEDLLMHGRSEEELLRDYDKTRRIRPFI